MGYWSTSCRTCLRFQVTLELELKHSSLSRKLHHFNFRSSSSSSHAGAANDHRVYTQIKSEISSQKQIIPTSHHYHHEEQHIQLATTLLKQADCGNIKEAQITWSQIINSSLKPTVHLVSSLIGSLAKTQNFDEINEILIQLKRRPNISYIPEIYSLAISCFGFGGRLDLMESAINQMVSMGFTIDSVTVNSYLIYYSIFGSLSEMGTAYLRLKKSRILIEEQAIKAVSFRLLRERKHYKLGEFLRDVGLGRRNVGNLLWNLLLLSYAVNFKLKTLQREFINMIEAGFRPDLTTFNIRAIVFSKMNLFWDLHLSLEHMKFEGVAPDLVTYGCVVDAYVEKRLVQNLDFAFGKMGNFDDAPAVMTDYFVFEALGKGDFHLSCEAFMEFSDHNQSVGGRRRWSYRKLVHTYVKKQRRTNQIFWNY